MVVRAKKDVKSVDKSALSLQTAEPALKNALFILALDICAFTAGAQTLAGTMGAASISSSLQGMTSSATFNAMNSAKNSVNNQQGG